MTNDELIDHVNQFRNFYTINLATINNENCIEFILHSTQKPKNFHDSLNKIFPKEKGMLFDFIGFRITNSGKEVTTQFFGLNRKLTNIVYKYIFDIDYFEKLILLYNLGE